MDGVHTHTHTRAHARTHAGRRGVCDGTRSPPAELKGKKKSVSYPRRPRTCVSFFDRPAHTQPPMPPPPPSPAPLPARPASPDRQARVQLRLDAAAAVAAAAGAREPEKKRGGGRLGKRGPLSLSRHARTHARTTSALTPVTLTRNACMHTTRPLPLQNKSPGHRRGSHRGGGGSGGRARPGWRPLGGHPGGPRRSRCRE